MAAGAYPVNGDTLQVLSRGACAYRKANVHPRIGKGMLFRDIRTRHSYASKRADAKSQYFNQPRYSVSARRLDFGTIETHSAKRESDQRATMATAMAKDRWPSDRPSSSRPSSTKSRARTRPGLRSDITDFAPHAAALASLSERALQHPPDRLLAALERFPVGMNRDSQAGWKRRFLWGDSSFRSTRWASLIHWICVPELLRR